MNNQYNSEQPSLFIAGISTRYNKADIWDRVDYAGFGRIRDIVLFPVSNGRNCQNAIVHYDFWADSRGEKRNHIKEGKSLKVYHTKGDDRFWEACEYDPYRQDTKRRHRQQEERERLRLQQEEDRRREEKQRQDSLEERRIEDIALRIVYNRDNVYSELYQTDLRWAISILESKPRIFAKDLDEATRVLRPRLIRITHLMPKSQTILNQDRTMKPVAPIASLARATPVKVEFSREQIKPEPEQEQEQEPKPDQDQAPKPDQAQELEPDQAQELEPDQEPEPVKKRVCQNSTSYFDADNIERDSFVIDYGNVEIPIRGRKLRLAKQNTNKVVVSAPIAVGSSVEL